MKITRRQMRQIILEELNRLQETEWGDDPDALAYYAGEDGSKEEGSGYEHLRYMPNTIDWEDGPVDQEWLHRHFNYYKQNFSPRSWPSLAGDFEAMLAGVPRDPDIVENYRNPDGTGVVSRQTVEALVAALHGGR